MNRLAFPRLATGGPFAQLPRQSEAGTDAQPRDSVTIGTSLTPTRFANNPILTPRDVEAKVALPPPPKSWVGPGPRVSGVFNPGAAMAHGADGQETVGILFRIYDAAAGKSYIGLAESADGSHIDKVHPTPAIAPTLAEEEWGVEDARAAYIKDDGQYAITYTGYSKDGACVCLITTPDLLDPSKYVKHGKILDATNKNTVFFPEKINGQYAMLQRPHPDIAISFADKITGPWSAQNSQVLLQPLPDTWRSGRVGAGAPPVRTPLGWMLPFHGAQNVSEGNTYCMGWMILDGADPTKVRYVSTEPALAPATPYEIHEKSEGPLPQLDMNNFPHGVHVVFPQGLVEQKRGGEDRYLIYYGAGDEFVGAAFIDKHKLWDSLRASIDAAAARG